MTAKADVRSEAFRRRVALPDKDAASRSAVERLTALPEYAAATTVLWYADARSELRTRSVLPDAVASGKTVAVPWCDGPELRLFALGSVEELAEGAYGIPEPSPELRGRAGRSVRPESLDLIVVPGVAFDRRGGRVGHGRGYYDRLLADVRPDAVRVGLCFECQLFDSVPAEPHDLPMDLVITESAVYDASVAA